MKKIKEVFKNRNVDYWLLILFFSLFQEACHCFPETVSSKERESSLLSSREGLWIGCTRQKMPQVFSALNALNETMISKLWIWDSLINIIPADMFAQVTLTNI